MRLPVHDVLVPKLIAAFPPLGISVDAMTEAGPAVAVFPAAHPEVGDVVVYDREDEAVIFLGHYAHAHISNFDESLDANAKTEAIATEVVEFLRGVFADEVIFYGNRRGGGWGARSRKRGLLSKFFFGERTYVWSGPLE